MLGRTHQRNGYWLLLIKPALPLRCSLRNLLKMKYAYRITLLGSFVKDRNNTPVAARDSISFFKGLARGQSLQNAFEFGAVGHLNQEQFF